MLVLKKLSYIPEVLFFFPPSLVKLLYFAARERQLFNFPSPLDVSLWWYCCSCCLKGKKHSYNTGSSPKWKRTVRIPLWPSYEKAEGNTWLYIKKKKSDLVERTLDLNRLMFWWSGETHINTGVKARPFTLVFPHHFLCLVHQRGPFTKQHSKNKTYREPVYKLKARVKVKAKKSALFQVYSWLFWQSQPGIFPPSPNKYTKDKCEFSDMCLRLYMSCLPFNDMSYCCSRKSVRLNCWEAAGSCSWAN